MTVQNFAETQRTTGSIQSERKGPINELINRRYKREFVVWTDDILDGPETVYGASINNDKLPEIGDTYTRGNDTDSIATCIDVEVEPTESPFVWKYLASYDSARLTDAVLTNPLNLPAEIVWGATTYERAMPRDLTGIACVNSSGEAFDPPIMFEELRPTVTISRNETAYNPAIALQYQNAVNLTTFFGAPPLCAKMTRITGQKMIDIGFQYWKITYEIEFRGDTFCLFVLDQGYRDITKKLFRDPIDFAPMANPTLLNGSGGRLTDATSTLQANISANDTVIQIAAGDIFKFPIGPQAGTPNWYYEIKIENEIMQVQGGFGTQNLTVVRGYASTTPAAHASTKPITMQPYYLRFIPAKIVDFTPLDLPSS